jgi:transposase
VRSFDRGHVLAGADQDSDAVQGTVRRSLERVVQAAWAAIKTPGPLHAFYCRVKARRGAQIAIVAVARKLAILTWHLLTTQRDYAYQRPQLVARKLRRLELQTGAPTRRGRSTPRPNTDPHDLQRARHAETRYADLTANWQPHPLRA